MLGSDLIVSLANRASVIGVDMDDFDIRDKTACTLKVSSINPDCIVNCAAYTNVDGSESNFDEAMAVNAFGAENMALAARQADAFFVQISTDYVYDGSKAEPYTENDKVNPINNYGRTKLEGETRVLKVLPEKTLIIRTAWLFGAHGSNFIETIIKIAKTRETVGVINDQTGCPTFTQDLAAGIADLIRKKAKGIVHLTNSGNTSWYGFASFFMGLVNPRVSVLPIPARDYPLPAKRPEYSVLSLEKYKNITGNVPPNWKDAVRRYLKIKHPNFV